MSKNAKKQPKKPPTPDTPPYVLGNTVFGDEMNCLPTMLRLYLGRAASEIAAGKYPEHYSAVWEDIVMDFIGTGQWLEELGLGTRRTYLLDFDILTNVRWPRSEVAKIKKELAALRKWYQDEELKLEVAKAKPKRQTKTIKAGRSRV